MGFVVRFRIVLAGHVVKISWTFPESALRTESALVDPQIRYGYRPPASEPPGPEACPCRTSIAGGAARHSRTSRFMSSVFQ